MNGSTRNQKSESFEKGGLHDVVLTWGAACRMLPLVKPIVEDFLRFQQELARRQPEKDRLDRNRRNLAWPERSRRYALQEEISSLERSMQTTFAELDELGITLIDSMPGQVGFPTLVNNRRAFFSWRPGEETVSFWHFSDELDRRTIPSAWTKSTDLRTRSRKNG